MSRKIMINMRPHLLTVLALLMTCFLKLYGQGTPNLSFNDSSWVKPYEAFRVAGNLYYVGTYDLACFLITSPKGHILINTGLVESVPMIKKSIESLGFKFTDIKILLTTQAHYDHVAGMTAIKKLTGAKMMVHEGDAQVLTDGGSSDFYFGGKGVVFEPVTVDEKLKHGDTVKIGDTKVLVLHHPGHTKGSTSFLVDVKDENRTWKVLIANIPTILPQTRMFGMPSYPNVGKDYQETLKSMKAVQFDIWVASHASQFGLHRKRKAGDPYNPGVFADRALYDNTIDSIQRDYERRLKREEAQIKDH
jgi:metallo-beta-lactamase class B